jgi:type I restriction enzyme S subunit
LRYFYYQYFDWYKRNIFNGLGAGVRQTLSAADLVNYQVVFPPIDEQDQIVRFLDWKTAEMNRVIHAKNQEIRKLKELRVIAINTAVTKGIKGSILKKSGSTWLNEIPEDWDMLPSKRLFFLRKEKAKPEDEQLTASQKYGVVPQKWFMEQEGRRVTVVFTGEDILKRVEKGDFVISMRSFQGGIEYSDYSGKISSAYVMLIPNHEYVYDRFFKWFLKSPEYIKALRGTSDLVRDGQALRYANFAKIDLPVVPMDEQIAIADYLDNICKRIDDAIENVKKEISLIQELKTRTIFDVVTGKVDVRGISIPTYEDMADEILDEDSEDAENEDEEVDE